MSGPQPPIRDSTIYVLIDAEPTTIPDTPGAISAYFASHVQPICTALETSLGFTCTDEMLYDFAWSNKSSVITDARKRPRQTKEEVMALLRNRVAGVFNPQPPQHPACGSARGVSFEV